MPPRQRISINDQSSRGGQDTPEVTQSNHSWKGLSTSGLVHDKSDRALSPIEWVKPEEVKPVEVSGKGTQTVSEKNLPNLEEGLEHAHSFVQTSADVIDSLGDEQA